MRAYAPHVRRAGAGSAPVVMPSRIRCPFLSRPSSPPPPRAQRRSPAAAAAALAPAPTLLIPGRRRHFHPLAPIAAAASGAAGYPQEGGGEGNSDKNNPPAENAAGSAAAPALLPKAALVRVVLPTALALLVCNMDRICLSVAVLPMSRELGWQPSFQGVVQSAFLWGYAATQLLGGTLADRHGGRRVMALGVLWFSLASAALPLALSAPVAAAGLTVPAVLAARCAVGLGEGVALPAMNSLVAANVPAGSRATALGLCFGGFHSGNLVGLALSPLLLAAFGWRALFYVFGFLGLPLLALWLAVVPGKGEDKQGAGAGGATTPTAAAPPQQPAPSVARLLSSRHTWAIVIVNFVNHWGYFIYLNWMPSYFARTLGLGVAASSALSFLPWLLMALGSSAAGVLADGLVARRGWSVTRVRKTMQSVAFLVPALALGVLAQPALPPAVAVGAMCVALGATSLGQAGFVANMTDIAPTAGGRMFGLCNTFGCAAGVLGVTAVGVVVEALGSFAPVFSATAGMYVFATAVWLAWCTGERVF
jgi:ACS family sodium-dependent inorganic phosphate cotransporter/ACS family sodium-dependent inorganic phosphate cotransporter-like MFS transporter 9